MTVRPIYTQFFWLYVTVHTEQRSVENIRYSTMNALLSVLLSNESGDCSLAKSKKIGVAQHFAWLRV